MPKKDDFKDEDDDVVKADTISRIQYSNDNKIDLFTDMTKEDIVDIALDIFAQIRTREIPMETFFYPEEKVYETLISQGVDGEVSELGVRSVIEKFSGKIENAQNFLETGSRNTKRTIANVGRLTEKDIKNPDEPAPAIAPIITVGGVEGKLKLMKVALENKKEMIELESNNGNDRITKIIEATKTHAEKLKAAYLQLQEDVKTEREAEREALRVKSKRIHDGGGVIGGGGGFGGG